MMLLLAFGLRPRQIVALKVEDFAGGRLRVNGEWKPLAPDLYTAIHHYLRLDSTRRSHLKATRYLFQPVVNYRTLEFDKAISEQMIRYLVDRWARYAGIDGEVSPKHLRPQYLVSG